MGSAGSEEKVEWLLDEAKIDYAFNYKNTGVKNNISSELKKACPEGIDLYFDNVGGKHLEAAIDNMKTFGRIVLCGMISQYNAVTPYALSNLFLAITNRLRLHGFIVRDHYDMLNEFHCSMIKWINEGKIKWNTCFLTSIICTEKGIVTKTKTFDSNMHKGYIQFQANESLFNQE